MSRHASLVDVYATAVRFPDVSGFEVLELLKLRSRLAEVEGELTPAERSALEGADATFVLNAVSLFRQRRNHRFDPTPNPVSTTLIPVAGLLA